MIKKDVTMAVKMTPIHRNMIKSIRERVGMGSDSEVVRAIIEIAFSNMMAKRSNSKHTLSVNKTRLKVARPQRKIRIVKSKKKPTPPQSRPTMDNGSTQLRYVH